MTNQKRTQLQIVEDKRAELRQGLQTYKQYLDVIPVEKQEDFKKNFLELATQDYLLSIIDVKEIIRFTANITKIGLDITPSSNEVYIIPFDTKVNGTKVMLPQAIIPLNGMQQLAYNSGFMLTVDPVYKFNEDECAAARELTRLQQAKLNTADPKWLDKHFIGYDVVLKDLVGNLGEQTYFVDVSYVKAATKTNKDLRWSLSTWTHKAVRKAYKQFLLPRDRALEQFEKLEHLNDKILLDVDSPSQKQLLTSDTREALKSLGLKTVEKDGYLVVEGNTYKKTDFLKQLGFEYRNNSWCKELPVGEEIKEISQNEDLISHDEDIGKNNPLAEYGLEIVEKTANGKTYQIIEGETSKVEDVLIEHGFSKGKKGKWGKEKGLF